MKDLLRISFLGACATAGCLLAGSVNVNAQDQPPPPGNFDPQQMRQRMSDRMREQFGVTDESEWKVISERINKVMEARRGTGGGFGGPGGFGGGMMRPPGGPGNRPGGDSQGPGGAGGPGGGGGFGAGPGGPGGPPFMRASSPEEEALRKGIEAKASNEELKALIVKVQASREKNKAALAKAQEELKQVLSVQQEAVATSMGLL